jgi:hypothetical protein
MNSTVTNKLFNIKDFVDYSPFYIETGSSSGASIERALNAGYISIDSVEADKKWLDHCINRFGKVPNVTLWYGLSQDMLPEMLKSVDRKAVILLDAHPTGAGSAGHDDLMEKGDKSEFQQDTIITKELKAILTHKNDHCIVIDDQNGSNEDNLAYREMLLEANPNYKFFWYDEKLNEEAIFYKNKILVAIV